MNESMIDEWSYGTPELDALLARERRSLSSLRAALLPLDGLDVAMVWHAGAKKGDLRERFLGALSTEGGPYAQKSMKWDELDVLLTPGVDRRPAMKERPTATWPPPPLPPLPPKTTSKPTTVW